MSPLYRHVLGVALDALPPQLRALHDSARARRWSGRAEVHRGAGVGTRLVGWVMRLPPRSDDLPVSVTFTPKKDGELWVRDFGGHIFSSRQYVTPATEPGLVYERFGIVDVAVAIWVEADRLVLEPVSWSIWWVPLPKALMPRGQSFETQVDDCFVFDIEISMPWLGRLAAYRGWLKPDEPGALDA